MQPLHADTASQPPAAARHAQVVPSFIVPSLARTLECWAGTVNPGELVRWERPADLTESARRELRNGRVLVIEGTVQHESGVTTIVSQLVAPLASG